MAAKDPITEQTRNVVLTLLGNAKRVNYDNRPQMDATTQNNIDRALATAMANVTGA